MKEPLQDREAVTGLHEAIARYGVPVERCCVQEVSRDTFEYWAQVRRKRTAEVVLLLRIREDRYLVHTKSFYPQGVYRLLSGGVKPHEPLSQAVCREAHEETGLRVDIERFLAIIHNRFRCNEDESSLMSYLFVVRPANVSAKVLDTSTPEASAENITGYREVALPELAVLAAELESLPPDWADWGRFRAVAHRLAVELLSGR